MVLALAVAVITGYGGGRWAAMHWAGASKNSVSTSESVSHSSKPATSNTANEDQVREDLTRAQQEENESARHLQIRKIVLGLDAKQVEKLLTDAPQPNDDKGRLLERELITRWVSLDPKNAMDFANKTASSRVDKNLLYDAAAAWARKEPEAALEFLKGRNDQQMDGWVGGDSYRDRVIRGALIGMAEKGEDQPFAWALTQLKEGRNKEFTREILGALAANDISKTVTLFSQLPSGQAGRSEAVQEIMYFWARHDISAAKTWMESLTDPGEKLEAVGPLMMFWVKKDPAAAMDYAAKLSDREYARTSTFLMINVSITNYKDYLEVSNKLTNDKAKMMARESYLMQLNSSNPEQVRAQILTMKPEEIPQNLIHFIARNVEPENRQEVLDWARQLPGDDTRNSVTREVIRNWAADDPKEAALYVVKNNKGDMSLDSLDSIGRSLGDRDPKEGLEFSKSLPEGQARDQMVRGVMATWTQNAPQDAAAYIMGAGDTEREKFESDVINRWSQLDSTAASQWVVKLPESNAKTKGVGQLAERWAQMDSTKAAAWIKTLPQSASRDIAVEKYTRYATEDEPQTAASLATSIVDEKKRNEVMEKVAKTWLETDATSAQAWINSSNLPQETKNKLLQPK